MNENKFQILLKMTDKQKAEFWKSFDLVLINCDGVLWNYSGPIERAGDTIVRLKKLGKRVKFVSNNSLFSDKEYIKKFINLGIKDVSSQDIMHPFKNIKRYLNMNCPKAQILSLCSNPLNEALKAEKFNIKTMKPIVNARMTNICEIIKKDGPVDVVLLDLNFNLSFTQLAKAHQYLQDSNSKCKLIIGSGDLVVPLQRKTAMLGTMSFVHILHSTTGVKPIIVGKPGHLYAEAIFEQFDIKDTSKILFIGENIYTDIKFGISSGFVTMLVMSGTTKFEDICNLPEMYKPHYITDSVSDLLHFPD